MKKLSTLKKKKNYQFSILNSQFFSAGFTLIELLIVVAIIGVLATILFSNYLGVRQRARDSQRKSNLRQIQAALELIRSDTGSYPGSLYSADCPISSPLVVGTVTYMQKIPCDPNPSVPSGIYKNGMYPYGTVANGYNLRACIENVNDTDPNILNIGVSWCSTSKVYTLFNP